MAMKQSEYQIKKELQKWSERVLQFDVEFKPDTEANLTRLDEGFDASLEHFVIISANSEALVYKIAKYFISTGKIKNDSIVFIDGKIVESYIGDDSAAWRKKERADDFFEIFSGDIKGKWVLIPYMNFEIDAGLAIYFTTQFIKFGAFGLIFYSEGKGEHFAQVLSLSKDDDKYYFQFPKAKYRKQRRSLPDDPYW